MLLGLGVAIGGAVSTARWAWRTSVAPANVRVVRVVPLVPTRNREGRWGYASPTGTLMIEPQFRMAERFSEGRAAVEIDDGVGFIDESGRFVVPPTYDAVSSYRIGLAKAC